MTDHVSIPVRDPRTGEMVDIDAGIAELVGELWRAGIRTRQSCENYAGSGYVWLDIDSTNDLAQLLGIVRVFDPEPLSMFGGSPTGKSRRRRHSRRSLGSGAIACSHIHESVGMQTSRRRRSDSAEFPGTSPVPWNSRQRISLR